MCAKCLPEQELFCFQGLTGGLRHQCVIGTTTVVDAQPLDDNGGNGDPVMHPDAVGW